MINAFLNFRNNGLISAYYDYEVPLGVALPLLVLCAVCAYLLGCINWAVIISRRVYGEDVRNFGSGNGGTTNMMRNYGTKYAVLTLLGDMAKALAACLIGISLMGIYGGYVAGFFCVLGHCFPVFYKFHGGKGVATVAMVILCLSPVVCLILFIIFVILVIGYKYISLASVMCMLLYPVLLNMVYGANMYNVFAIAISLLIVFMHRENLKRLINHTENKFEFRKRGDRSEKE